MPRSALLVLFAVLATPCLAEDVDAPPSILLVARKALPDPFFNDSVVLVTSHGRAPLGVIVNKPMPASLASVFPEVEALRSRPEKLFFGGPVSGQQMVAVFRAPEAPPGAIRVLGDVYMTSSRQTLMTLFARDDPLRDLRVYIGHAAWAPGQLEAEISRGNWHLLNADAATLFSRRPERLWEELHRRASATTARGAPPAPQALPVTALR